MAEGDEKIDHNDRVLVLNRLADAPHEGLFNGITLTWQPGEVRSIQRDEVDHYIQQSRVLVDPTGENPGTYKLVVVDAQKQPLYPGTSIEPLTKAYCKELTKYGFLDTTNLGPDRTFGADGSMQLADPETGQHPGRMELRGAPREGAIPQAPPLARADRSDTAAALDNL